MEYSRCACIRTPRAHRTHTATLLCTEYRGMSEYADIRHQRMSRNTPILCILPRIRCALLLCPALRTYTGCNNPYHVSVTCIIPLLCCVQHITYTVYTPLRCCVRNTWNIRNPGIFSPNGMSDIPLFWCTPCALLLCAVLRPPTDAIIPTTQV